MNDPIYRRFQAICLKLPEAVEKETWGEPTFRIRDKIFAVYSSESRPSATCKAPPGVQQILVGADPARFYVPAYVGPKGWIGIRLDEAADWTEIDSLITRSYRLIAPKRLAALV